LRYLNRLSIKLACEKPVLAESTRLRLRIALAGRASDEKKRGALVPASVSRHDIAEAAARLNISIDQSELEEYRRAAAWQIERLETFIDQPGQPNAEVSAGRDIGHAPSPTDDPYRAWVWKCDIQDAQSGLLANKTVGFKDHISVAGIPQSFGSRLFGRFIPEVDATVVSRVLSAGGRIVGKNSMNGFMNGQLRPLNPHDITRTSGGSSSGSAVAVAAGEADIAFGGDQGGSIRIPSAYCGVFGLKPTFGLISHFGVGFGFEPSLDHVGPIARTIEDLAAALQAVAGADGLDSRQERETPEQADVLSALHSGVRGLRIGILEEGFAEPIEADVRDAVLKTISSLQDRGAIIRRVSVPEHLMADDAFVALALEGSMISARYGFYGHGTRTRYPLDSIVAVNEKWLMRSEHWPASRKLDMIVAYLSRARWHGAVYAKAQNARSRFIEAYDDCLQQVDVMAMPTVRTVAPPVGSTAGQEQEAGIRELDDHHWAYQEHTGNTKQSNYTGHPALSIPCGSVRGLPVGLQVMGQYYEERVLLRVGMTCQELIGEPKPQRQDANRKA
jgi:amidase